MSHSSKDKSFAQMLSNDLKKRGIQVWIDEAELKPGDSIIQKISDVILNVDYVGVILSPSSVKSDWVRKEISIAMSLEIKGKNIEVIPLLYKPCDIPIILRDKLYADFTQKGQYNIVLSNLLKKLLHKERDKIIISNDDAKQHKYFDKRFEILDKKIIKTGFSTLRNVMDTTCGKKRLLKQTRKKYESILDFKGLSISADNISIPLEQWEDDLYYYEILEFVNGWTLEDIIGLNNGNVLGELLTSWTKELLNLLIPLHRHEPPIIHRDFRPSNILVRKDNLNLVLIDCTSMVLFDLNKRYIPFGTSGYTPLEVIEGYPYPASDLYSLGCILFRINTGKYPPNITQIENFGKSMELVNAEHEVDNVFKSLIALRYHNRFSNAIIALKNMKPPVSSRHYTRFQDFHLPDGRIIKQGGWF